MTQKILQVPGLVEINAEIEANWRKLQGDALTIQFQAPLEDKNAGPQAEEVGLFESKLSQGRLF